VYLKITMPKQSATDKNKVRRPPIVTLLGHVDHGKTSLLSAIKEEDLTRKEFGGISQHTRAYQVEGKFEGEKRTITFIDTPGHEAFSKMRSRGGKVADLVILVVAADDGVQPQTKEAVAYAREANVPIIVALNKMDLKTAQPDQVKRELAELDLAPEDWGGQTTVVPVSATKKEGIAELLEMILLWAETSELKSNPEGEFSGVVIEAHLDPRRGPVATVLIKGGSLKVGEEISIIGALEGATTTTGRGKVKALFLEGKAIKIAGPSAPAEVLGFSQVPEVGALVAKGPIPAAATAPITPRRKVVAPQDQTTLNVILKADAVGTAQAVEAAVETIELEGFKTKIIASGIGAITDSDLRLANDTKSQIFAFNTGFALGAESLAKDLGIEVQQYQIIYHLIKGVTEALEERYRLAENKILGVGEVIEVFTLPRSGDRVAGTKVFTGELKVDNRVRIIRDSEIVHRGKIKSIQHKRDEIKQAKKGLEVGLYIRPQYAPKIGDIIEVI